MVREYLLGQYQLPPEATGAIALGDKAEGSPSGNTWDGTAIALFVDKDALRFEASAIRPEESTLSQATAKP
jgi:hypothetical protein